MAKKSPAGVFFSTADYASLWRRMGILCVDCIVLGLATCLLVFAAAHSDAVYEHILSLFLALSFIYMVWLKTTRWGTVGYRLAGVRLVDLRGNRASLWRAAFRFMFAVFGPGNLIIDLLWLSGDDNRQCLRDKFAATYVVRDNAAPVGGGAIRYNTYFLLGNALMFQEVDRREVATQAQGKG